MTGPEQPIEDNGSTARNRAVQDNLDGLIPLSDLEFDLIRSGAFARLGRLRQLGMAGFVFPGATHTRAAHSLGVMHTVGKASRVLGLDREETDFLRVGGLLHDIGQYPLSHCIELLYRSVGSGVTAPAFLFGAQAPEDNAPLLRRMSSMKADTDDAKDKVVGALLLSRDEEIREILRKHGWSDDDCDRLANLVGGSATKLMHNQLLDSPYDCDRLDYVRRDNEATGVSYGTISVDFLLRNMVTETHPPNSGEKIVVFDGDRSVVAVEQYLLARYGMYSQVYFHKTVRSLELIAKALFLGLAEKDAVHPAYASVHAIVGTDSYLAFDDSYFWQAAHDAARSDKFGAEIQELAQRVVRRRPLQTAFEYRTLARREDDASYLMLLRLGRHDDDLARVCSQAGVNPDDVVVDRVPAIEFVPESEPLPPDQLAAIVNEAASAQGANDRLSELLASIQLAPRLRRPGGRISLLTGAEGSLIAQFVGKRILTVRFYLTTADRDAAGRLNAALRQYSRGE